MSAQLVGSVCTHGYLAQLVEHLTVNQIVGGSIPSMSVASYGLNSTQSCRADRINNF